MSINILGKEYPIATTTELYLHDKNLTSLPELIGMLFNLQILNLYNNKLTRLWVDKNTPGIKLILAAADKKQNYSKPNRILIDDKESNVEQWISKGGEGILHKNTADTIKQLQQYGL